MNITPISPDSSGSAVIPDRSSTRIGFAADEINTSELTRTARLKWVIVVNTSLPAGRAVNAAVCVASATVTHVDGILGPAATDSTGSVHPGLPWAGCSILTADTKTLRTIRDKGEAHEAIFVADMPQAAQDTRIYDDYLTAIKSTNPQGLNYLAVSLVGPKNRIDRIIGKLPLLP